MLIFILLPSLIISHYLVYIYEYINFYQFMLIVLSDIALFLPLLAYKKYNMQFVYIFSTIIILIIDSRFSSLESPLIFFLINMPLLLLPLRINNSKILISYILFVIYGVSFINNTNIFFIEKYFINFSPITLMPLIYIPLIKKLNFDKLIPEKEKPVLVVCLFMLGLLMQIANPLGLTLLMSIFLNVFTEEIVFRAWVLDELSFISNKFSLIGLSSAIFALFHIPQYFNLDIGSIIINIISTFAIGSILSYIYLKNNSITFPIIVHIVVNIFIFVAKGAFS